MSRTSTSSVLDQILQHKRDEIAERRRRVPEGALRTRAEDASPPRGFVTAITSTIDRGHPAVIAEIKKASPSKGVIRADFDPATIAKRYQAGGAACLSVLTDERFFQGSDAYLQAAREAVALPVLRKDFVVDTYQLFEARALGADCVLLIVAALDIIELTVLHQTARSLAMDVLVEVHDEVELEAALSLRPDLVGINNRNLKSFETTLETTYRLLPLVPEGVTVVTESGIAHPRDVAAMRSKGVHAFLVGEALMREHDPGEALRLLIAEK